MTYSVTLVGRDGRAAIQQLEAETPYLACSFAEHMHGGRAVAVVATMLVLGRCETCGGIILDNDRPRERRGKLRCNGCL